MWNEFFELLVKKTNEKFLEISVMARFFKIILLKFKKYIRDPNNGDDFIGMAKIDFSGFGTETKDLWVNIYRPSKKKEIGKKKFYFLFFLNS